MRCGQPTHAIGFLHVVLSFSFSFCSLPCMDIDLIFDRWSVSEISKATGISRVTLRALRDMTTKRVQHRTLRALADWLNEPVEMIASSVRRRQLQIDKEPRA